MKIPIDKIKVNSGRRKAQPEAVKELARSIADIGMGMMDEVKLHGNSSLCVPRIPLHVPV